LIEVQSPLTPCRSTPTDSSCADVFRALKNPYYIGDHPALTQTSGWVDAWTSSPSAYAVAAETTSDVVSAVNFARTHNLRLVVKGGGHSYQGTSSSADSLLVWTRAMNGITLHDEFVPHGCSGAEPPQPALTVGSGCLWMPVYDAATTRAGRYVQGGGCGTVGVAGLVQSGGFGSFSKNYGLAAAGLLEAEVVTADGVVRTVSRCSEPDLYWALKGGGGGSLGIVTRLTLRTRPLPEYFGGVFGSVKASSDAAFHRLAARVMAFYREQLFNPYWGEQIRFERGNVLDIRMVFQGLTRQQAEDAWRPIREWVSASPADFAWQSPLSVLAVPARRLWDPAFLRKEAPALIAADDRPGAPEGNILWAGDQEEAGHVIHGYRSLWLPASLLGADRRRALVDALVAGSRHWGISLHFNKGLAGAPAQAVAAARDTAMNPAVLDAFALAIIAGGGPPAFPGVAGHEPDVEAARRNARAIDQATSPLSAIAGPPASYVSESNFFEPQWQQAFWGANYSRLAAVKQRYDPDGLFFVHHGVGSERWSDEGFRRRG
jgi:FAD/FMN-containing dehydrogenase